MPKIKQWEDDSKILKAQVLSRTRCKRCGCTRTVRATDNKNICRNCGYFIFRTNKDEFIYRVKERINYDKRNERSSKDYSSKK